MSFKHKLSKRLAISWRGAAGLVPLAVLLACRVDHQALTDPSQSVLEIQPDQVGIDYQQTVQFRALLRSPSGDTVPVWVQWSATGGTISEEGLFTADTTAGDFAVTAEDESGRTASATVGVGYSGPIFTRTNSPRPGRVRDLAVTDVTPSAVTLRFTEGDDGTGRPAQYHVRFASGSIRWGSGTSVTQGTCASPMAGTTIGATRTCTVQGLQASTAYEFQMVAFRGTLNVDAVFGGLSNIARGTTSAGGTPVPGDTIFTEGFESGSLSAWEDGVDASRHRVLNDPALAHSGNQLLEVTYPPGTDGGWLTHFFMPGYDSLYVSYWVRFPTTWLGGTKLIAFYGSRTDNQWSAFGQAGKCPTGTDFFSTMVVAEGTANPGPTRFYSYYPAMAREPDGVTCWGRFGDGTETYVPPLAMSAGAWHHVEFWVKLNTPNQADAVQTFWLDGVQRGTWGGFSFRTSTILRLNSVQLTFSNSETTTQTQTLYVDDIVVRTQKPGTTTPAPVASVTVSPASASLTVGSTQQLTATLTDATGTPLTGRTVDWTSNNTGVATVSGSGLVTAVAAGSATITATSEMVDGTASATVAAPAITNPSKVTDLAVSSVGDTSATLRFTEVNDGTGKPASYDVRFAAGTISWGPATSVTQGTCKVPLAGTTVGTKRTCRVLGLNPSTAYQFQLVAFRGTLNVDAAFGELSNVVATTTKPKAVASVTVSPSSATLAAGATQQFTATLKDNRGNVLTGRTVTWASSNAGVSTVSTGLATAVAAGTATITATSGGVKGTAAVTVTAPAVTAPGAVTNLAASGVTDNSVTLDFTEVGDGTGNPASYDVRFAAGSMAWGSATGVTQGTCKVPMSGTTIGAQRSCTVLGLTAGTTYEFQMVAFRRTLNVDAVFGALSNVARATTTAGTPAPVASVTVSPASASLTVGSTQQLTATLTDATGTPLTGRTVDWSSSLPSLVGVSGTGLVSGLLTGTATITATSEGQSGTATVSVTAGGSLPGLHEPAGFRALNDQPWNALTGNGWNYLRRASVKDASIIADVTAPRSPSSLLQIVYTAGCCSDAEPSVHWMSVPGVKQIYTAWWMKLSSNWIPNPAGGGKITFLWPDGGGQVYTNLYHQGGDETGWVSGPPYRVGLNTEWSPYGQHIWLPNVATTGINPGEWHRIEVYYQWGTAGNGVLRWWVDGVLNGDYTNVSYPSSGTSFQQFEFAPTVQYAGSAERYLYIDHTYASIP